MLERRDSAGEAFVGVFIQKMIDFVDLAAMHEIKIRWLYECVEQAVSDEYRPWIVDDNCGQHD